MTEVTPNLREGRISGDIDPLGADRPDGTVAKKDSTSGSSSRSVSLPSTINKRASDALLEKELLNALGINPTAKMKAEFFKGLKAFLKAYGSRSSSTSRSGSKFSKTTSSSVQGAEPDVYIREFISQVVKDEIKKNPGVKFGGIVGDTVNVLAKYSADMGVFKSDGEVVSNAISVMSGTSRQEDILNQYRKDAQALYANFAPRLAQDASLTVRDLANPYIQMMADTFEGVADNIKLTDDTIQKAIHDAKGLMNLGDFRAMLRKDPRFNTTTGAKREAADLATSMLRSFGFGA